MMISSLYNPAGESLPLPAVPGRGLFSGHIPLRPVYTKKEPTVPASPPEKNRLCIFPPSFAAYPPVAGQDAKEAPSYSRPHNIISLCRRATEKNLLTVFRQVKQICELAHSLLVTQRDSCLKPPLLCFLDIMMFSSSTVPVSLYYLAVS